MRVGNGDKSSETAWVRLTSRQTIAHCGLHVHWLAALVEARLKVGRHFLKRIFFVAVLNQTGGISRQKSVHAQGLPLNDVNQFMEVERFIR